MSDSALLLFKGKKYRAKQLAKKAKTCPEVMIHPNEFNFELVPELTEAIPEFDEVVLIYKHENKHVLLSAQNKVKHALASGAQTVKGFFISKPVLKSVQEVEETEEEETEVVKPYYHKRQFSNPY